MCEKTNNLGSDQIRHKPVYTVSEAGWKLEISYLRKRGIVRTICLSKTKALISFSITAKLICGFVFAYANCCWFSLTVTHIINIILATRTNTESQWTRYTYVSDYAHLYVNIYEPFHEEPVCGTCLCNMFAMLQTENVKVLILCQSKADCLKLIRATALARPLTTTTRANITKTCPCNKQRFSSCKKTKKIQ